MAGPPEVVVVGGGITGVGIARDLAMRGAAVTLLERDRLAEGTTGRMHGLLHSGARYAVSDPTSARQCIQENGILREIASHCIEDTGGLFVSLESDDPEYFAEKLEACEAAGIPTETVEPDLATTIEPALSDTVEQAFLVPDAAVDPFRLVAANARSAADQGADIKTGREVVDFRVEGERVTGVVVRDRSSSETSDESSNENSGGSSSEPSDESNGEPSDESSNETSDESGSQTTIDADWVVNGAGPWVADVLDPVELDVPVSPAKGAMAVTNSRPVDTVINRCRPKDEGDILVPHETTAILGTTDVAVEDPDEYAETRAEIDLLVEEIEQMVPAIADTRLIRTYWGVRPLFEPEADPDSPTETSRDYAVLDHGARDGVSGLTTVLGGKLTTYRLMAEDVADRVADRLGLDAECRTATEPLPGSRGEVDFEAIMAEFDVRSPIAKRSVDRLGDRTRTVLDGQEPNPTVCECEGVTEAEVRDAIDTAGPDLGAVRMRTRATMGTCQGGFCSHRLGVLLADAFDVGAAWSEIESLLEERWTGQRFVLDGDHLSQAMLNRAVWQCSLNLADGLQGGSDLQIDRFDSGRSAESGTGDAR